MTHHHQQPLHQQQIIEANHYQPSIVQASHTTIIPIHSPAQPPSAVSSSSTNTPIPIQQEVNHDYVLPNKCQTLPFILGDRPDDTPDLCAPRPFHPGTVPNTFSELHLSTAPHFEKGAVTSMTVSNALLRPGHSYHHLCLSFSHIDPSPRHAEESSRELLIFHPKERLQQGLNQMMGQHRTKETVSGAQWAGITEPNPPLPLPPKSRQSSAIIPQEIAGPAAEWPRGQIGAYITQKWPFDSNCAGGSATRAPFKVPGVKCAVPLHYWSNTTQQKQSCSDVDNQGRGGKAHHLSASLSDHQCALITCNDIMESMNVDDNPLGRRPFPFVSEFSKPPCQPKVENSVNPDWATVPAGPLSNNANNDNGGPRFTSPSLMKSHDRHHQSTPSGTSTIYHPPPYLITLPYNMNMSLDGADEMEGVGEYPGLVDTSSVSSASVGLYGRGGKKEKRRAQNRLAQRAFRARLKVQNSEVVGRVERLEELNFLQRNHMDNMSLMIQQLETENDMLRQDYQGVFPPTYASS